MSEVNEGRGPDIRAAATQLVQGIYRLVRACMLYGDNNQAVLAATESLREAAVACCEGSGVETTILVFAMDSVFVNGQVFRGSREAYTLAKELGAFLEICDVTEVAVDKGVSSAELVTFGRAVADGQRDKAAAERVKHITGRVRARRVHGAGAAGVGEDGSALERLVRTYAGSVVIMRQLNESVKAGIYTLPQAVKRVSQKLVAHAEQDARHLIALAASAPSDPDPASLAVNTAVLALSMARQLTSDRLVLGGLASAALLYDVGRPRLLKPGNAGRLLERALTDEELDRLPASTVIVLTALGKIHPPSVSRSVVAYESLALRRPERPTLYRGRRPPSVLARILTTARSFIEQRMATPGAPTVSIDDAIQLLQLEAEDATARTYVKILVGALGIFPAGTMVELNTGEMGVVVSTPALPVDFPRPPVQIMYDAAANVLETPFYCDLSQPPAPGEPVRYVRRPIDADAQQMKAMRAFALSAASKRSGGGERDGEPSASRSASFHGGPQSASRDMGSASRDMGPPSRGSEPTGAPPRREPIPPPRESRPESPGREAARREVTAGREAPRRDAPPLATGSREPSMGLRDPMGPRRDSAPSRSDPRGEPSGSREPPPSNPRRDATGAFGSVPRRDVTGSREPVPPPASRDASGGFGALSRRDLAGSREAQPPPVSREGTGAFGALSRRDVTGARDPAPPSSREGTGAFGALSRRDVTGSREPQPPPVSREGTGAFGALSRRDVTGAREPGPSPRDATGSFGSVSRRDVTGSREPLSPPSSREGTGAFGALSRRDVTGSREPLSPPSSREGTGAFGALSRRDVAGARDPAPPSSREGTGAFGALSRRGASSSREPSEPRRETPTPPARVGQAATPPREEPPRARPRLRPEDATPPSRAEHRLRDDEEDEHGAPTAIRSMAVFEAFGDPAPEPPPPPPAPSRRDPPRADHRLDDEEDEHGAPTAIRSAWVEGAAGTPQVDLGFAWTDEPPPSPPRTPPPSRAAARPEPPPIDEMEHEAPTAIRQAQWVDEGGQPPADPAAPRRAPASPAPRPDAESAPPTSARTPAGRPLAKAVEEKSALRTNRRFDLRVDVGSEPPPPPPSARSREPEPPRSRPSQDPPVSSRVMGIPARVVPAAKPEPNRPPASSARPERAQPNPTATTKPDLARPGTAPKPAAGPAPKAAPPKPPLSDYDSLLSAYLSEDDPSGKK